MQPLTLISTDLELMDVAKHAATAEHAEPATRSERLEALRSALRQRFPQALSAQALSAQALSAQALSAQALPAQALPAQGNLAQAKPAEVAPTQGRPADAAVLGHLLPEDGLPRGRITEWACARSGGSATLLRALVRDVLARGEAVALVDAGRSLAAADWVEAARVGELTVVRPPTPEEGPFCAELLLDARAFALVVLDGVGLPPRLAPRLAHRVREAGSAFLVVLPQEGVSWQGATWQGEGTSAAALRIALAPLPAASLPAASLPAAPLPTAPLPTASLPAGQAPAGPAPAAPRGTPSLGTSPKPAPLPWAALPRIVASLVKGAAPGRMELCCVVPTPDRLCAHPLVPDRRGGARHGRSW